MASKDLWQFVTPSDEKGAPLLVPVSSTPPAAKKNNAFTRMNSLKSAIQDPIGSLFGGKKNMPVKKNVRQRVDNPGYDIKGDYLTTGKPLSVINVVDEFMWTNSPKRKVSKGVVAEGDNYTRSRDNAPYLIMREKQLTTNTQINQLIYSLLVATDKTAEVGKEFEAFTKETNDRAAASEAEFQKQKKAEADAKAEEERRKNAQPATDGKPANNSTAKEKRFTENVKEKVGNGLETLKDTLPSPSNFLKSASNAVDTNDTARLIKFKAKAAAQQVAENINKAFERAEYEPISNKIKALEPYDALYITRPTGFIYYMPYFSNAAIALGNNFTDTAKDDNNPVVNAIAAGAKGIVSNLTSFNLTSPGTYIESPKFYGFDTDGEEYTFSFPLLNTRTWQDVRMNWQLIYMLTYQNSPNRITRDRINPAVLYEISVPGVFYSPYAYVSRLTVDFKGTRQLMEMNTPPMPLYSGDTAPTSTVIETIIPEAYIVTITVKSLIPRTRNTQFAALAQKNIVTTYVRQNVSGFGEAAANVKKTVDSAREGVSNIFG